MPQILPGILVQCYRFRVDFYTKKWVGRTKKKKIYVISTFKRPGNYSNFLLNGYVHWYTVGAWIELEGFFLGIFQDLITKVLFWKKFWTNI